MEVLLAQYHAALDLYKHEDSLNWSKLQHLFYVTAGMIAVLGFILTTPSVQPLLLVVVCATGFFVSLAFCIALNSGVTYLNYRKNAVIRIEERLVEAGGEWIVNPSQNGQELASLVISRTTYVLRYFPVFVTILWPILFLVLLNQE